MIFYLLFIFSLNILSNLIRDKNEKKIETEIINGESS